MRRVTDQALLTLLERNPEKLDRYLRSFPDDIERLDGLTQLDAAQVVAVEQTVAAPSDIVARVARRMTVDGSLREAGEAFAELLRLGFLTARVVFDTEHDIGRDDQRSERTPE